jgi:V/A-type H+-transporting ATPase subunit D
MAKRMRVSPTRSNLLRLREQLSQARAGHALLEHKREVLTEELLVMIQDAEATDAEAQRRFGAAYASLFEVRMRMGSDRLQWASLARVAEMQSEVALHSIMGVPVPLVQVTVDPLPLPYSLGDTSAVLDEARARWLAVAELLGRLAETATAVWRLATELRKTQRRVNALEFVLIPQVEETLRYIAETLEEQEREAFVRAKRVKLQQQAGDGERER